MNEDLIKKFQELKTKHSTIMSEKVKCEAKRDQLESEIKSIQDKYKEYDLSTVESVEKIIKELSSSLELELNSINERYSKIKNI